MVAENVQNTKIYRSYNKHDKYNIRPATNVLSHNSLLDKSCVRFV
jgi:hypothetical protein